MGPLGAPATRLRSALRRSQVSLRRSRGKGGSWLGKKGLDRWSAIRQRQSGKRFLSIPCDTTVFIVDDDEPVRDSLRLLLESHDLDVRDYGSCPAFMRAYREGFAEVSGNGRPGCLLLDLHMPQMTGLDFVETHGATLGGLPVIIITGRSDPQDR